jgi:hypothetical protein
LQVPLTSLWPAFLTLLVALIPGAAYVSVINDFTDRADDLAAGKKNRMIGRSPAATIALIGLPLVLGAIVMLRWRDDALLLTTYGAAWLAYSCYSLPPIRLKTRGLAGVLADACGAHLFPSLLAAILIFRVADRPIDPTWLIAVGLWSLAYGLRGILWHQLSDRDNDAHAGVRTFAQRNSAAIVAKLATRVAFPLELMGLAWLLWQLQSPWPVTFLLLYVGIVVCKRFCWKIHATVVGTRASYLIVLQDYYGVFLPAALLIAATVLHPSDGIALALHGLLFPYSILRTVEESYYLSRSLGGLVRLRLQRA